MVHGEKTRRTIRTRTFERICSTITETGLPITDPRTYSTAANYLASACFLFDRSHRTAACSMQYDRPMASVCDALHGGWRIHPTAEVSEPVNRNCPLRTRFYNFQPATPTLSPQTFHPQSSKFYLFIISCFVDHVTILFMLMRIAQIVCWWESIVIAVMTGIRSASSQQQQLFLV